MTKKSFLMISLLTAMLSLTSVSVYADPTDILYNEQCFVL